MKRLAASLVCALALVGAARAQTDPEKMFKPQREKQRETDRTKELRLEAQRLAFRAAQLGTRAEELWDRGKYEESDKLAEEANDLRFQQRRVEARAKWIEMHPGQPMPKDPLALE